ncbi:MAG: NAD(P)-dependent oxidoreductase [Coriobacteriales bacterium]|jgi:3-hydroxyisobutyrate dehydrogenase|nr:NAD(P)-dependent oxidoreductase [Coriobacteriales bacterium]
MTKREASGIAFILQDELGATLAQKFASQGRDVIAFVQPNPDAEVVDLGTVLRASSIADALDGRSLVFTLLQTAQDVEDIYLGTDGVLQSSSDNSYFVDLSTSSPRLARELHALAAVHDSYFVDAALEGDSTAVARGEARAFVGGETDILAVVLPLIDELVGSSVTTGLPGTGAAARLATLIAQTGNLLAFVEGLAFAQQAGIENSALLRLLGEGQSTNAAVELFGAQILAEDYYGGTRIRRYFRDLSTALDAAEELDLTLPGLETAYQLYDLLALVGGNAMGAHALSLIYQNEDYCAKYGLDWELAQRAMDVYDHDDYGDYSDCDDCDDPDCGSHPHHHHHHDHREGDDSLPGMGGFFSSN